MNAGYSDELWVLSTTRMEWTLSIAAGESPSARVDHAMTASGTDVYLFGGNLPSVGKSRLLRQCTTQRLTRSYV
jgi:hypothetical protein